MGKNDTPESQTYGPEIYEIRIQGHLRQKSVTWYEGLEITFESDGTSTIYGPLPDQTALHSILLRIRDMNLKLISVKRIDTHAPDKKRMWVDSRGLEPKK
jgi:hypothetical protein